MSDEKHKTCLETRNKNLSSSSSASNRNKFTLNEVGEQLESIRKLSETSDFLNSNELNNNSLPPVDEPSDTLRAFRMDMKRKSTDNKPSAANTSPMGALPSATTDSDSNARNSDEQATQMPNYSSLFTPRPVIGSRAQLRRQSELEQAEKLSSKKLPALKYPSSSKERFTQGDDDDGEDDDLDERLPFTTGMSKQRSTHRFSPETYSNQSPNKHAIIAFDNKCELVNHHHHKQSPHTKISIGDSRPPSFSTCQLNNAQYHELNRKLEYHHSSQVTKCDCSNCYKKFNSVSVDNGYRIADYTTTKYPKTYSLHLVLKSIILLLLTLLLLMLFLGIILASHHLPKAVERFLNTPHSFNVTIAG